MVESNHDKPWRWCGKRLIKKVPGGEPWGLAGPVGPQPHSPPVLQAKPVPPGRGDEDVSTHPEGEGLAIGLV